MYRTKEIRWFFKKKREPLEKWFKRHDLQFVTSTAETHRYLDIKKSDLNIKLREGQLEIKQRQGPQTRTTLQMANGFCEQWTKWSFGIETLEPYRNEWIEVIKNRLAVNVVLAHGNLAIRPVNFEVESGCQVEYTRLRIGKSTWYTFGLEWFGNKKVTLTEPFVADLFDFSHFTIKQSMGYATFLKDCI